jgi:hypothetical protein
VGKLIANGNKTLALVAIGHLQACSEYSLMRMPNRINNQSAIGKHFEYVDILLMQLPITVLLCYYNNLSH